MLQPPEVFGGSRVQLRRSTAADYAAVFPVVTDPEVMYYMDWKTHASIDETRQFFAGVAERWDSGEDFHWIVQTLSDKRFLGSISCRIAGHAADFGYLFASAAWGCGYASEAVALLVGWLKAQPEVLRIWATTDIENVRSQRVLERAGLLKEGTLRMATYRPQIGGLPRDKNVYALVKTIS